MKGLLLKDWYMTVKYCKMYLIIVVLFYVLTFHSPKSLIIAYYPCMVAGLIPVTLLAYDERSRWTTYSMSMPYTKTQIVSSKFLFGLIAQIIVLTFTGVVQTVRMVKDGGFVLENFMILMMIIFAMSLVSSSITLPFIFKFGVEKGRMAYYVMIGILCAISVGSSKMPSEILAEINLMKVLIFVCLIAIAIYALAWLWSVKLFQKREF